MTNYSSLYLPSHIANISIYFQSHFLLYVPLLLMVFWHDMMTPSEFARLFAVTSPILLNATCGLFADGTTRNHSAWVTHCTHTATHHTVSDSLYSHGHSSYCEWLTVLTRPLTVLSQTFTVLSQQLSMLAQLYRNSWQLEQWICTLFVVSQAIVADHLIWLVTSYFNSQ